MTPIDHSFVILPLQLYLLQCDSGKTIPTLTLNARPEDSRTLGTPKATWIDDVEKEAKKI